MKMVRISKYRINKEVTRVTPETTLECPRGHIIKTPTKDWQRGVLNGGYGCKECATEDGCKGRYKSLKTKDYKVIDMEETLKEIQKSRRDMGYRNNSLEDIKEECGEADHLPYTIIDHKTGKKIWNNKEEDFPFTKESWKKIIEGSKVK